MGSFVRSTERSSAAQYNNILPQCTLKRIPISPVKRSRSHARNVGKLVKFRAQPPADRPWFSIPHHPSVDAYDRHHRVGSGGNERLARLQGLLQTKRVLAEVDI